jgi:hypothetical protein
LVYQCQADDDHDQDEEGHPQKRVKQKRHAHKQGGEAEVHQLHEQIATDELPDDVYVLQHRVACHRAESVVPPVYRFEQPLAESVVQRHGHPLQHAQSDRFKCCPDGQNADGDHDEEQQCHFVAALHDPLVELEHENRRSETRKADYEAEQQEGSKRRAIRPEFGPQQVVRLIRHSGSSARLYAEILCYLLRIGPYATHDGHHSMQTVFCILFDFSWFSDQ